MIKKIIVPIAGIAALALLMAVQAGAFATDKINPGIKKAFEITAQDTLTIEKESQSEYYHSIGTIRSRDEIDVIPRIIARILEVKVRSGDSVKRGDIIAVLDAKDLQAAVSQGQEQYRAVSAAISAANEQIKSAEAALELAKKEHERTKTLYEQNAIAKRTFDEASTALKQAEAARQQAIQQKRAAQAQAAAAGQSIKQAEVGYEYATVLSPIDGIVAERLADPGDLGNPSSVILRIFDPQTMLLEVPIRESLVKDVIVGTEVIYKVSALDKEYTGKVIEVVPYVDPSTRTFLAKISINDPSELMPGMYGTVKIPLKSTKDIILIPESAVTKTGQLESVTELKDNALYRRQVKTIKSTNGMLEVVSGLTPGQKIVKSPAK
ncbi:MAG: efflux RND transporter periplasmic adaptor subunit [Candidatus Riflebacteria bacterium]|nr:efflux RND transporter periplasmic adaptor subunit [Candidatus Riflebacteria bacterium]